MNLSIRFPNISAYFEGMNKSFTVFGFEITVYGILVAVGMLLGLVVIMLQVRKHKENPNLYLGMVLISLIGGLIGILMVWGAMAAAEALSGMAFYLSLTNINIGVVISAVIGLLAGIMPAYMGARMDPVEAIRSGQ